jgi:hypothetical protein
VLSIIAFALLSILNARELAQGSGLARGVCAYIAIFWGIRVALQGVFDAKEHLAAWWLKAGYHALTVLCDVHARVRLGGLRRGGQLNRKRPFRPVRTGVAPRSRRRSTFGLPLESQACRSAGRRIPPKQSGCAVAVILWEEILDVFRAVRSEAFGADLAQFEAMPSMVTTSSR